MRLVGPASEAEMVLAYLRSEIDAPRWRADLAGINRALLDDADLSDPAQNEARVDLLGLWRGFRRDAGYFEGFRYFEGFPPDVQWQRWSFTVLEVGNFLYANYITWLKLSQQTRLVKVGAANVDRTEVLERGRSINSDIRQVADAITKGRQFEQIICATEDEVADRIVIIEGHTRATAYLYAARPPTVVTAIVGLSPNMSCWRNY